VPTFVIKWLAPVLIVLALVGGIYAKGRIDSKHAAEIASIRDELATAELVIASDKAKRVSDANLAKEQAEKLWELKAHAQSIQEYADALEDAGRECLSGADNDRLRDLWK
jgi:hypothetical protein